MRGARRATINRGAALVNQPLKKHAAITAACLTCRIFVLRRYYYYSPSYYYLSPLKPIH